VNEHGPQGIKITCPGCREVNWCPVARYADDEAWAAFLVGAGLVPRGRRGGVHRTCQYNAEREGRPLETPTDGDGSPAPAGVAPPGAKPWRAR
jgi:hypothetical protein